MTKTLGELLREKLDNTPINIDVSSHWRHPSRDEFQDPYIDYKPDPKRFETFMSPIFREKAKSKQVKITVKGKEMIQYQSRILVSINGSNNLVLEADVNLLNVLSNARIAKVDRDWDDNVKSVKYTNDKPTITIVNAGEIEAPKPDPSDKIKSLEQLQEKLKAEQDAIAKQIDALSKD